MSSEPKRKPNRLIVDEATNDDNSVVSLHPATMERFDLFHGDSIRIKVHTYACMSIKLFFFVRFHALIN
jgi:hypothetical protein